MYKVEIKEVSKTLTAKEKIQVKDTTDCKKLDNETQIAPVIIDIDYYAILNVENDKSDDGQYTQYIIADKSGDRYTTGSESFWSSFMNLYDDMMEAISEGEDCKLKVYRQDSKNREGKQFITCSII